MEYAVFKVLLTRYDWRTEMRGVPKSSRYKFAEKLRREPVKVHLRYLAPLGIRYAVSLLRDPALARRLLDARGKEELGLPHGWYLHSVSVHAGGLVVATWFAPEGSPVAPSDLPGEVYLATRLPVANWRGVVYAEPPAEVVDELGRFAWSLLARPRLRVRNLAVALLVAAALDVEPMLSYTELRRALRVLGEAGEELELRARYAWRYYEELSAAHVVGRIYAFNPRGIPFTILAPSDCLAEVYGWLSATLRGTTVYYTRGLVLAQAVVENPATLRALQRLCPEVEAHVRTGALVYPTPYSLVDPRSGEWLEEPHPGFVEMLTRLRYVMRVSRTA